MRPLIYLASHLPFNPFSQGMTDDSIAFSSLVVPPGPLGTANFSVIRELAPELNGYFASSLDPMIPLSAESFNALRNALAGLEDYPCLSDEALSRAENYLRYRAWEDWLERDVRFEFGNALDDEPRFATWESFRDFLRTRFVDFYAYESWTNDGRYEFDLVYLARNFAVTERARMNLTKNARAIEQRVQAAMINTGWIDGVVGHEDVQWVAEMHRQGVVTNDGYSLFMRHLLAEKGIFMPNLASVHYTPLRDVLRKWNRLVRVVLTDDPAILTAIVALPAEPWDKFAAFEPVIWVRAIVDLGRGVVNVERVFDWNYQTADATLACPVAWNELAWELTFGMFSGNDLLDAAHRNAPLVSLNRN